MTVIPTVAAAEPRATRSQTAALSKYATERDLRSAKTRLGEALPDDGWLGSYVQACIPLTDAPVEFHLATGLAALSAAIGNRSWSNAWGNRTLPHLWAVIVAPSSFWRKSTSITFAESILADAIPQAAYPNFGSPERLVKTLSEQPWGMWAIKEFGELLALMGRDHMGGMKEILTALYDGPSTYKRVTMDKEWVVSNPAITILGASTLDWLESRVSENDLGSGFIPRFIFVTATEKATAKGMTGQMHTPTRNELVKGIRHIGDRGPVEARFLPEAHDELDGWMLGWEKEAGKVQHTVDVSSFANRLQTAAVKLSMLYALSRNAQALDAQIVVELDDVQRAIAYARLLYRNVTSLIDDQIATTKEHRMQRKIIRICRRGVTWTRLLQLTHVNARELRPYVETLVETGELLRDYPTPAEIGIEGRQRQRQTEWLRASTDSQDIAYDSHVDLASSSLLADASRNGSGVDASSSEPYSSLSLSNTLIDNDSHDVPTPGARGTVPTRAPAGAPAGAPARDEDLNGPDDAGDPPSDEDLAALL